MNAFRGILYGSLAGVILWCIMLGATITGIKTYQELAELFGDDGYEIAEIGKYNGFDTREEYEKVKSLHQFHGTNYSWEEHGKRWFMRDGRVCELWEPDTGG